MRNRFLVLGLGAGLASTAIVVPAAMAASGGSALLGPRGGGSGESTLFLQAPEADGDGSATPAQGMRGAPGAHVSVTAAAAEVLGLTTEELREALAEGQSILDYATAHGQDATAFTSAVTAAVRADIDEALANGDITQEQADAALADLDTRVAEKLASTGPLKVGPGRHGGRGAGCEDGAEVTAPDGGATPDGEAPDDDASTDA
jgi:hypothetical protein